MSNLRMPMTDPWATISSVRSSPGTLLKNTALRSMGAAVPKASLRRPSRMSLLSPMQGRMSPGLLTSNSLPAEPHTEQRAPRISVPQASHHLMVSLPLAAFLG